MDIQHENRSVQKEENKSYQLRITVTRHGPKSGMAGELSDTGKQTVLEHYQKSLHELPENLKLRRKIYTSPINRAKETANIYREVLEVGYGPGKIEIQEDSRLSENELVPFVDNLSLEDQNEWFLHWYNSEVGQKTVKDFSSWVLEQFQNQKHKGEAVHVDAFTHGPVMAGFILRLQEFLKQDFLGLNSKDKFNKRPLFMDDLSPFNYLGSISISVLSDSSNTVHLEVGDRNFHISLEDLMNFLYN